MHLHTKSRYLQLLARKDAFRRFFPPGIYKICIPLDLRSLRAIPSATSSGRLSLISGAVNECFHVSISQRDFRHRSCDHGIDFTFLLGFFVLFFQAFFHLGFQTFAPLESQWKKTENHPVDPTQKSQTGNSKNTPLQGAARRRAMQTFAPVDLCSLGIPNGKTWKNHPEKPNWKQ